MPEYSTEALGQVVRHLRDQKGITQERLGKDAGYKTGAGVSISRLESGLLRPSPDRFDGLAKALGLKPEELEVRASERTQENVASAIAPVGQLHSETIRQAEGAAASRSSLRVKDRARQIQQEIDLRTSVIADLTKAFNEQHDLARDEFFLPFVEIAARVEDAPQPDPTQLEDDDVTDPEAVAAYRLKSNSHGVQLLVGGAGGAAAGAAVGGVAAYGTFVAVASLGTASTGAAISGLTGVAATNAILAALGGGTLAAGGAGVAGGTVLLAGIVAAPAVILAAGGLLLMAKRNRKQQQELAVKLDAAEAELAATMPGVACLEDVLPRATATLDYIATHASHALRRWADQLGPESLTWESLGEAEQRRYQDFSEIAGAQLAMVTMNVQGLVTTRGRDQDNLIKLADQMLTQAQKAVESRV